MKNTFILITSIGIMTLYGANAIEINKNQVNVKQLNSNEELEIKKIEESSLKKLWEINMPTNAHTIR
ncbi:hypothetical protein [Fluviispira multicolorata]|uniref:Uncharacterized protein n=1 Tax=Fluviispira multicolorata TaxID=2654512 RepID=A0A833N3A0_9BACT|nr:hypothetical protein [Fluviispira multicolorata]KAB8033638.1 hypothetical protein GCL57_02715 [Fluviispira multicolorata]